MPGPGLAYAHLNLRTNPFGELDRADRAALAVVDIEPLLDALGEPCAAVQVVGPGGTGKTTHLLALQRRFPTAPMVRVPAWGVVRLPAGSPLFVDEAQFLSAPRRRALFRRRCELVLGTHEDLTGELERAGRRVVTVRPDWIMTPERFGRVVHKRIEWARRGPGRVPRVSSAAAANLLALHGGNVRAVEAQLYEAFQRAEAVQHVEV